MSQRSTQDEAISSRLQIAIGERTVRHVGALTNTHPETVRRYMTGSKTPTVEFLAAFCEALEINADWLLTGEGQMRLEEKRKAVIHDAGLSDVLRAMADTVDRLATRVDRMEAVLRMHDDRLRASSGLTPNRTDHTGTRTEAPRASESSRIHKAIGRLPEDPDEVEDHRGLRGGPRGREDG